MADKNQTVHGLLNGHPLCGFSVDDPADWPVEHGSTSADDVRNITCPTCKQKAEGKKVQEASMRDRANRYEDRSVPTTPIGDKGIAQAGESPDCEDGGILRI